MKKYRNYLIFNDKKTAERGGGFLGNMESVDCDPCSFAEPLLSLGECSWVGLIFDRIFQFARDDFKISLISDGFVSILIIIDGVKSQKHHMK